MALADFAVNGAPVAVGLGSNVDGPAEQVRRAAGALEGLLAGLRLSPLYGSAPMYVEDQPDFVNAVATGWAQGGPFALHAALKALEARLGRVPGPRNGPRRIDLDLLAFGCLRLRSARLELPHPRAMERAFVVRPWLDVAEPGDRGRLERALAATELAGQRVYKI